MISDSKRLAELVVGGCADGENGRALNGLGAMSGQCFWFTLLIPGIRVLYGHVWVVKLHRHIVSPGCLTV